jgi:hypothetical protein
LKFWFKFCFEWPEISVHGTVISSATDEEFAVISSATHEEFASTETRIYWIQQKFVSNSTY